MDPCTSFGPHGKSKIVTNNVGDTIITRDSQYFLLQLVKELEDTYLEFVARNEIDRSMVRGDGLLSSYIIHSTIIKQLAQYTDNACNPDAIKGSISILSGFNTVLSVVSNNEDEIVAFMTRNCLWRHIDYDNGTPENSVDVKRCIIGLCMNVLVPATNTVIACTLANTLLEWIVNTDDHDILFFTKRCTDLLKVAHVMLVAQVLPGSSACTHILDLNEVIIHGILRGLSSLPSNSDDDGGDVIIASNRISIVHSDSSKTIEQLIRILKTFSITVVFTSTDSAAVSASVANRLANEGIYLVDSVPSEHLVHLTTRAACSVVYCPYELTTVHHQQRAKYVGCLFHAKVIRAHFIEEEGLGESRSSIHITKVTPYDGIATNNNNSERSKPDRQYTVSTIQLADMKQLILQASTVLAVSNYANLLLRCIKVIAFNRDRRKFKRKSLNVKNRNSSSKGEVDADSYCSAPRSFLVVPGGGGAEMTWALLWKRVSILLLEGTTCADSRSLMDTGERNMLEQLAIFLVKKFQERMFAQLSIIDSTNKDEAVLRYNYGASEACKVLYEAYLQVPRVHISRCVDMLNLPNLNSSVAHQNLLSSAVKYSERALLFWQLQQQERMSHGASRNSVGIVSQTWSLSTQHHSQVDSSSYVRFKVVSYGGVLECNLRDPFAANILNSCEIFFDIFYSTIEAARQFLRIGGSKGIVKIRGMRNNVTIISRYCFVRVTTNWADLSGIEISNVRANLMEDEATVTPDTITIDSNTTDDNKQLQKVRARTISRIFYSASLDDLAQQRGFYPSLVIGMLYFKNVINLASIKDIIYNKLVKKHLRFRSVGVQNNHNDIIFNELDISNIDMHYHVIEIDSKDWKQQDIDDYISKQYNTIQDKNKPLWQFVVLNNLYNDKHCIIAKIDHAIGDGVAMIDLLLSVLDDSPCNKGIANPNHSSSLTKGTSNNSKMTVNTISTIDRFVTFFKGIYLGLLGTILPGDTPNCLKIKDCRNPGTLKACAEGEDIPLDRVKMLRKYLPGTTVNDILSAVLNMCICKYLEERKDPILNRRNSCIRANFPINMRNKSDSLKGKVTVGNRFSVGSFKFNLNYKSRIDLVWQVKRQIDLIKISPQPLVDYLLVRNLSPLLPTNILYDMVLDNFGRFTMMMSNVQGPATTVYFAGQPVEDINFQLFGPIGLYVGVLSYNGRVSLNVSADITRESNPVEITKHWKSEFDALYDDVIEEAKNGSKKLKNPRISSDWLSFIIICSMFGGICASAGMLFLPKSIYS